MSVIPERDVYNTIVHETPTHWQGDDYHELGKLLHANLMVDVAVIPAGKGLAARAITRGLRSRAVDTLSPFLAPTVDSLAKLIAPAILASIPKELTRSVVPRPIQEPGAQPTAEVINQPYFEFQVDKQVQQIPGFGALVHPPRLVASRVEGEVLAQFVVDANGRADLASFKVVKSSHVLFTQAVKDALSNMRFYPAEVNGKRVPQLVQQPFTFTLPRQ